MLEERAAGRESDETMPRASLRKQEARGYKHYGKLNATRASL